MEYIPTTSGIKRYPTPIDPPQHHSIHYSLYWEKDILEYRQTVYVYIYMYLCIVASIKTYNDNDVLMMMMMMIYKNNSRHV